MTTRQTAAPLATTSLVATARRAHELSRSFREDFGILLDAPYQRGTVWKPIKKSPSSAPS
ncbi:hypothetical protein ACIRPK_20420 [Kitasatospora sp. NPDC101801]|uniref:hypothetical protein n=1 Tax=Kitasatospora sp. NPDC101801 TaxID=3364103 RepID=UPI0037F29ECF